MKEIFIYIDNEGYFTCNTGITVDMWKTFLRDGKLMTPDRIDVSINSTTPCKCNLKQHRLQPEKVVADVVLC